MTDIGTNDQPWGVIFDVDGVLVDSYDAHFQSWNRLAAELGLDRFTETHFASTFGRTTREIIEDLSGFSEAFNLVTPNSDEPISTSLIAELDDRKELLYREILRKHVPIMPSAVELINDLDNAGAILGVGSSGPPENVMLVLEAMGIQDLLSAVVTGADVTRGKPDPEVFLTAAKRMNVPPSRCIVVEDASAGIQAAQAAGMPVIGFANIGREPGALAADQPDLVIHSLESVGFTDFWNLIAY